MFSGEGFSAVCQWALAEQGYRLERRERQPVRGFPEEFKQIEPVNLDSLLPNRPLADPKLFVSFAKLGASEQPSESKCLRWVQKYGLLRRQDESQGWAIVRREDTGRSISDPDRRKAEARRLVYDKAHRSLLAKLDKFGASLDELSSEEREVFDERVRQMASTRAWFEEMKLRPVERRTLNQAPISLDDFRTEVSNAHSALGLYKVLRERDVGELRARVETAREKEKEKEAHVVFSEVDKGLAGIGDGVLTTQWTTTLVFRAAMILEMFVKQKVASVRLGFSEPVDRPVKAPVYTPVQSWNCPDLLSAVYLQFYLWMIKAWPMRICENEDCSMPFPATRTDKRYCTDACRSAARDRR
jgi:hypothetical protein